jgi:FMN phosphatase YigB (HAD superfamily)/DNA-binding XRE family transcriptional regulator
MDEKGLGSRLQQVRREKGLTQQELCQKSNLSYSTLAKIERGAIKSPSIFTIQSIAAVLGVSLDELLGGVTQTANTLKHSKSGVSFVYFDVNGCLVRGFQRAFTSIAETTGALPDIIETTFWHYNDEVCRGTMSMSDFNAAMSRRLGIEMDWQAAYLGAVEPIKEMQELLRWAAENYKVGLLSNTMPGLLSALRNNGTLPNIPYAAIVDSSEIGEIKPGQRIYDIAQERAGCPAHEILFVDDTRANLRPAEQLGWHVAFFDNSAPAETSGRLRESLELATD